MQESWRRCSVCKDEIGLGESYFSCSVTTCNKVGRESVFCSPACWDAHVPVMNHKEASFEERTAPRTLNEVTRAPVRRIVREVSSADTHLSTDAPKEILIVVSKLKDYIHKRAGMNTSGAVAERLSDIVRSVCDEAIKKAAGDGRKTVMDRDFD